jgi:hypothetical protein
MFKSLLKKAEFSNKRWYSPLNYRAPKSKRPLFNNNNTSKSEIYSDDYNNSNNNSYYNSYNAYKKSSNSIINETHACFPILSQPTLIIERRIEYMNLFLGFEQANKYALFDAMGNQIGWLIERDFGLGKAIMRQIYRLHRPFTVDLIDLNGNLLLTIKRPFSFINSHIKAILPIRIDLNDSFINKAADLDSDGIIVGESVQSWHLWRRRYNLFTSINDGNGLFKQFGKIDSGFLRWEFPVFNENGLINGSISRNFSGLFREALTDTGVYVLKMDPSSNESDECEFGKFSNESLTLDEKAVMLANAVSIDFDYFSRHSGSSNGFLFFGGGGDDI